ncbi:MAG: hypothetical protein BWX70_01689 [Verrucomicrobia bacterium ADurb.Bin070]|nr:MAG: hypothetical protein BWX70_01689 [Verrucomicrobia bacterium ADurb.Bin070]
MRAELATDQMLMHSRQRQQGRNRRTLRIGRAVRKNQKAPALHDGLLGLTAQRIQRLLKGRAIPCDVKDRRQHRAADHPVFRIADAVQLIFVDNRLRQPQDAALLRPFIQKVAALPHVGLQRGHQLFADRIQRRIGHLRKQLVEIVEEQTGPF